MTRPPKPGSHARIEPFWLDYQRGCGVRVEGFSACALGRSAAVADELAELVLAGVKRAHATPKRDFERDRDPLPKPGDHLVVLDGEGEPRAIVRTTQVELRHFDEVDDAFAFAAGEGDMSLRWWLTAYRQEFAERAEAEGFEADGTLVLVLEHFERVWPPST